MRSAAFMLLAAIAALASGVSAAGYGAPASVCDDIQRIIPSFCYVSLDCLGISCMVDLFHVDTIGVAVKFHHCADPVNIMLSANESRIGLDWHHEFAGQVSEPIPDLSIDVPGLGSAGVYVAVDVGGSRDSVTVSVGLQACAHIGDDSQDTSAFTAPATYTTLVHALGEHGAEQALLHPNDPAYWRANVPGVGPVDFTKCLPDHPIELISGTIDFSGFPCDDDN